VIIDENLAPDKMLAEGFLDRHFAVGGCRMRVQIDAAGCGPRSTTTARIGETRPNRVQPFQIPFSKRLFL
jgi:hypothetical protein